MLRTTRKYSVFRTPYYMNTYCSGRLVPSNSSVGSSPQRRPFSVIPVLAVLRTEYMNTNLPCARTWVAALLLAYRWASVRSRALPFTAQSRTATSPTRVDAACATVGRQAAFPRHPLQSRSLPSDSLEQRRRDDFFLSHSARCRASLSVYDRISTVLVSCRPCTRTSARTETGVSSRDMANEKKANMYADDVNFSVV
ncbi:hypothetical protein RJ55_08256 [Drechmeria coniospora]|nr:hypothetical protein RJ55_08256 [Drechmeria coniospora]